MTKTARQAEAGIGENYPIDLCGIDPILMNGENVRARNLEPAKL